jgi:RimJ/RimL family protein N-acetyltransferase
MEVAPLSALEIDFEGGCLRYPTDEQLWILARSASEPDAVLTGETSHFVTWIQNRTADEIAEQRIAKVRSNRDLSKRPGWTLDFAVMVSDQPIGMQTLSGFDGWPRSRTTTTTSWLLAPFQGRGLGIRSRAAVLELAFSYLMADSAKSWALEDNRASIAISTKLGYDLVDRHDISENGKRYTEHVYQLDRDAWLQSEIRSRYIPTITGAGPVMDLLKNQ